MDTMKALVIFYSRTGTTKKVAGAISANFGCDLEEIIDTKDRSSVLGWLKSGIDTTLKKSSVIKEIKMNPTLYDLVIIGTPVWNNTLSSSIRTYLYQYKESFKRLAFFCTLEGSESKVFREMELICGKKPLALLKLRRKEVEKGEYMDKVRQLIVEINNKL